MKFVAADALLATAVAKLAENEVAADELFTVAVKILAEKEVAADDELADAVWNAPQADADTITILSVWVLLVVEILADNDDILA